MDEPFTPFALRSPVEVIHLARVATDIAASYASGVVPDSIKSDESGTLARLEDERHHWAEQVSNLQEEARMALVEACRALSTLILLKPGDPSAATAIHQVQAAAATIEELLRSGRVLVLHRENDLPRPKMSGRADD